MRKQNTIIYSCIATVMAMVSSVPVYAIDIEVVPSKAPNANSSPSFSTYNANAIHSLENTLGSPFGGTPVTDPTAYAPSPSPSHTPGVYYFNGSQIVTSSFPSWNGQANPSTPFDGERGNLIHFGVRILGQGTKFALRNLEFDADSTDSGGPGGNGFFDPADRNFINHTYDGFFVGIDYGDDNAKGGVGANADTIYNSGETGSTLVDELIYVGSAVGAGAGNVGTDQERLDSTINFFNNEGIFSIFGTYNLYADSTHTGDPIATGTAELRIPEPSSILLLSAGLLVISNRRPRKPKQA